MPGTNNSTTTNPSKAAEYIGCVIALLAIILNICIIGIVRRQLQNSSAHSARGLRLVLFVAMFDLIGPLVAVGQEIVSVTRGQNVMDTNEVCQILGAVHSMIPFMTAIMIALIALERSLFVRDIHLNAWFYPVFGFSSFLTISLLAIYAAINGGFVKTPSRLVCMVSPHEKFQATLFAYAFIAILTLSAIIICISYTSIISLCFSVAKRTKADKTMKEVTQSTQLSLFRTNSLASSYNSDSCDFNPEAPYSKVSAARIKAKAKEFLKSNGFILRAGVIMSCYLILLIPSIVFLINEAIIQGPLPYYQSVIVALFLFSVSLVNPLLLILLHTSISQAFMWAFQRIFARK